MSCVFKENGLSSGNVPDMYTGDTPVVQFGGFAANADFRFIAYISEPDKDVVERGNEPIGVSSWGPPWRRGLRRLSILDLTLLSMLLARALLCLYSWSALLLLATLGSNFKPIGN